MSFDRYSFVSIFGTDYLLILRTDEVFVIGEGGGGGGFGLGTGEGIELTSNFGWVLMGFRVGENDWLPSKSSSKKQMINFEAAF